MNRWLKLCAVLGVMLLLISGCGNSKGALKGELRDISLTKELPAVRLKDCHRLREVDEAVYEQQIAACEMYSEAYSLTKTSDYRKKYKDVNKKNVAQYCQNRRQELQLDIATQLNDNIYEMIKTVEDCSNISAYLKRVNYDAVNFYDYYTDYINSPSRDSAAACRMLTAFYEKSNILAFRFMGENKDEIIEKAVDQILTNSHQTEDFNKYISINNELVRALNTVYGGVPSEYADVITKANIRLVRNLLEEDNDLSSDDIEKLMSQLGEPTPEPAVAPTPEPTKEPDREQDTAPDREQEERTDRPATPAPEPRTTNPPAAVLQPRVTARPQTVVQPTPRPTPRPTPAPTPEVYIFE